MHALCPPALNDRLQPQPQALASGVGAKKKKHMKADRSKVYVPEICFSLSILTYSVSCPISGLKIPLFRSSAVDRVACRNLAVFVQKRQ